MFSLNPVTTWHVAAPVFAITLGTASAGEPASPQSRSEQAPQTIAWVGDTQIMRGEYQAALHRAARETFYHGKVVPARLAALRRDVVNRMIDERLLLAEADRRGVTPDPAAIDGAIARFEERNRQRPDWVEQREKAIAHARESFVQRARLRRLEALVRQVGEPTDAELLTYYLDNSASFTEPERARVSAILLHVDPSSPSVAWESAINDANKLASRLRAGESFEDAARLHSADGSADKGGDLGYIHRGMLAEPAERALDLMAPGEISSAIRVLQGVLVVRLRERVPARLRPLAQVRERAVELWRRDRGTEAWKELIAALRAQTRVALNEAEFSPLSAEVPSQIGVSKSLHRPNTTKPAASPSGSR